MKNINFSIIIALFIMINFFNYCKQNEVSSGSTTTPTPTVVSYNVTLNYNGKDTPNTTLTFSGTALNLPTPLRTGYTFNAWYDNVSSGNYISSPYTPTKDITIYAQWTPKTNFINFNTNGGSGISSVIVLTGNKLAKPANPIKTGYAFEKWYQDSSLTKIYNFDTTINTSFILYAKWIANPNFIAFNTNGGSTIDTMIISTGNKLIKPTNPTKKGYTFTHWSRDGYSPTNYNFNALINNSFTLYANWFLNSNTIVFNTNGGNIIDNVNVNTGSLITKPTDPKKQKHTFDNWYSDANLISLYNFNTIIDSLLTLYAKWIPNDSLITFNVNPASTLGFVEDVIDYNFNYTASKIYTDNVKFRLKITANNDNISFKYKGVSSTKTVTTDWIDAQNFENNNGNYKHLQQLYYNLNTKNGVTLVCDLETSSGDVFSTTKTVQAVDIVHNASVSVDNASVMPLNSDNLKLLLSFTNELIKTKQLNFLVSLNTNNNTKFSIKYQGANYTYGTNITIASDGFAWNNVTNRYEKEVILTYIPANEDVTIVTIGTKTSSDVEAKSTSITITPKATASNFNPLSLFGKVMF